ncbi:MAG: MFS transporter [Rhodanobacter sp.]|nr:MAG: MFS transporter [Rhodanobacter sp.]TAM13630.1 MAG: MFS transporter [Rhodanobacter sp.]TAM35616.1 MAG: MFS transporter [Rhodanobacter sp.]
MDQVSSGTAASGGAVVAAPGRHRSRDFRVVAGVSSAHMLNDIMQSVILALYPLLKGEFDLTFFQIGAITLTFQLTASMLQPVVGTVTDKHPFPLILPIGMAFTMCGLLLLSVAPSYPLVLVAVALIGCGSSTFHPESSRVARLASGGQYGLAQSLFQIGGNTGQALGPLLAAFLVLRHTDGGRPHAAWFALMALLGMVILLQVSRWYRHHLEQRPVKARAAVLPRYPAPLVRRTIGILLVLMISKFFYLASISSYYTFYVMHQFGVSAHAAANLLAVFLFAVAAGTLIGGPLGDRVGRRRVIWLSILGCAPFTLMLPHVGLHATIGLSIVIGLVLASAFPAIIVYAQDMLAHRIGMVSGLFYGFSFGLGGLGAGVLGLVAEHYGIVFVYQVCAFLPLLGMLAIFLPDVRPPKPEAVAPGVATP